MSLSLDSSERDDLIREEVDAIGFYRTRVHLFEKEGIAYELIKPEQYGIVSYNDVLIADPAFVKAQPELVRNFVAATIEGWDYALDHQEEAVQVTMNYVTHEEYKDIEYQRSILRESGPLIRPSKRFDIGSMDMKKWSRLSETIFSHQSVGATVNLEDIVSDIYLP